MEEKVSMVLVSGWHGVTSREHRKGKGRLGRQGPAGLERISFGNKAQDPAAKRLLVIACRAAAGDRNPSV